MTQLSFPIKYEECNSPSGMTALAGLPLYLDLIQASSFNTAIKQNVSARTGGQGWTDCQMIMTLIMLNLTGGESVRDVTILEGDDGLRTILKHGGASCFSPGSKRGERWRRKSERVLPSESAIFDYLKAFHDPHQEKMRRKGKAFIPAPTAALRALYQVNARLLSWVQDHFPQREATIDMDATLAESHKDQALWCYKGFPAYQPLNAWWGEQGLLLHSEFRDGNVPAGYEQCRVFQKSLSFLPDGVEEVSLRSDSAGYQWELLTYCAEGKNPRFGVIPFAVSADVGPEFKRSVAEVADDQWHPLIRRVDGREYKTGQQWAEVCYVPNKIAFKKNGPTYRYLAIREKLAEQLTIPGVEEAQLPLPFPTVEFGQEAARIRYKLQGIVTNRTDGGEDVIWWHRKRCGTSEKVHSEQKTDLAGGRFPSGLFGANAAWWAIMILAYNLNSVMRQHILDSNWVSKRMKSLRFTLINRPGRVVTHSRRVAIKVHSSLLGIIDRARERIVLLVTARPPT